MLIDVFGADPEFGERSREAVRDCLAEGGLVACDVVWAEVTGAFADAAAARGALERLGGEVFGARGAGRARSRRGLGRLPAWRRPSRSRDSGLPHRSARIAGRRPAAHEGPRLLPALLRGSRPGRSKRRAGSGHRRPLRAAGEDARRLPCPASAALQPSESPSIRPSAWGLGDGPAGLRACRRSSRRTRLSWRAAGACLAPSPATNPKGSVLVPV